MFLELIESVFILSVFLFFASQIFYPLWRGTALFPMFHREPELLEKLMAEKQITLEKDLEEKIKKEKGKR